MGPRKQRPLEAGGGTPVPGSIQLIFLLSRVGGFAQLLTLSPKPGMGFATTRHLPWIRCHHREVTLIPLVTWGHSKRPHTGTQLPSQAGGAGSGDCPQLQLRTGE